MDLEAQEMIEYEGIHMNDNYGTSLQVGMTMVGFDGRVIATTGSSEVKDGNLLFDRASDSILQPGSSIKPIFVYPIAHETGITTYSGLVDDSPIENYYGPGQPGPNNSYSGYKGMMTIPEAISWSANAATVKTMELIGTQTAYNQAVNVMGFKHLDPEIDSSTLGALSLGGMAGGVTVREMAAAMQYVGNGGLYYEPYTYYYVTDQNGTVILDNRNNIPDVAYSPATAYAMNRTLKYNVETSTHTYSSNVAISGWEILGKTGTTDYDRDSWFVGASPYCTLAIWTGYDTPDTVYNTRVATDTWRKVMVNYLEDKEYKEFDMPSEVIPATYCKGSGLLTSSFCAATATTAPSQSSTSTNEDASSPSEDSSETAPSEGETTAETTAPPEEVPSEAPPEDIGFVE